MLAQQVALLAASLFAGAAIFVSVAEHPARLGLEDAAMLYQWRESYRRAAIMQAGLAMIAGIAALWAWRLTGAIGWLVGALLILANWPWTLVVMKPINRRLSDLAANDAAETRSLLVRWGRLHAVRGALGIGAALLFLWSLGKSAQ